MTALPTYLQSPIVRDVDTEAGRFTVVAGIEQNRATDGLRPMVGFWVDSDSRTVLIPADEAETLIMTLTIASAEARDIAEEVAK